MGTRAVIEQYFAALNEGRAADMEKLKAPDSTYWMSGEGSWPFGGDMSGEKFAQLWAIVQNRFVEGHYCGGAAGSGAHPGAGIAPGRPRVRQPSVDAYDGGEWPYHGATRVSGHH